MIHRYTYIDIQIRICISSKLLTSLSQIYRHRYTDTHMYLFKVAHSSVIDTHIYILKVTHSSVINAKNIDTHINICIYSKLLTRLPQIHKYTDVYPQSCALICLSQMHRFIDTHTTLTQLCQPESLSQATHPLSMQLYNHSPSYP